MPAIFTHIWRCGDEINAWFSTAGKGVRQVFSPLCDIICPHPSVGEPGFLPERVFAVCIKGSRAFFGTRQMRPVTMEGESRLPAASTTTTGISTLSTNDLVFHTVCSVSLDHCYLSREWILHFST